MGPAVFTAGDKFTVCLVGETGIGLQWGPRFSPRETDWRSAAEVLLEPASMGPAVFTAGDKPRGHQRMRFVLASMGPAVFTAGDKAEGKETPLLRRLLQWGPRFSPRET